MSKPTIDMLVESSLWKQNSGVPRNSSVFKCVMRAAKAVGTHPGIGPAIRPGDEICVSLIDDEAIATLNGRWRGKDAPTNVLSFPAPQGSATQLPRYLGDIALAFETIDREAKAEGRPFEEHVAHLVVHGILHLLGYDHLSEGEAERMEALETSILARIGVADPYATEAA
jgi:probable rRNA maturation factor